MNLKNLDKELKLNVPQGYFQKMEQEIYAQIGISAMDQIENPQVPEDYFEELENNILNTVKLDQSLNKATWEVPEGYFDQLESEITDRIKIDGIKQEVVEESYFAELEEKILAIAAIEEMNELQYEEADENYFDKLEASILKKTVDEKKAKFKILRNFSFSRGAAAAVIIGMLAYGMSLFSIQAKDEFSDVSSDAIIAYLSDQNLDQADLSFIVEDEEDDYFLIDDFSDYEIQLYLQENGI